MLEAVGVQTLRADGFDFVAQVLLQLLTMKPFCRKLPTRADELSNLRIVLVETRNPLNIGAAARAMSNFGASDLRLVQPYDPSYRVAKSAVGATHVLRDSRVYDTVAEAVG